MNRAGFAGGCNSCVRWSLMRKTTNTFSAKARERAVRLVFDNEGQHGSRLQAIVSIAAKIGCSAHPERVGEEGRGRQRQACGYPDRAGREDEGAGTRQPRVTPGKRHSPQGQRMLCDGGARPPVEVMVGLIDAHRDAHGVGPICTVLPIAPPTAYEHPAKRADPSRLSERARRDEADAGDGGRPGYGVRTGAPG